MFLIFVVVPKYLPGGCGILVESLKLCLYNCISIYTIPLVIRQKGESQNGCFKKTKHAKFSEKRNFLRLDRHSAYQGLRNIRFSENLMCFVFLKHPFWDSPFCLITDDSKQTKTRLFIFILNIYSKHFIAIIDMLWLFGKYFTICHFL